MQVLLVSACQPSVTLNEQEGHAFADQVEASVENSLQGLNDGDYARHSRNFDDDLKDQINEITFPQVREEILGRVGMYKSHSLIHVEDQNGFRTVVYDTRFERDDHVILRVLFSQNDAINHIAGMWFDSPALRGN